MYPPPTNDQPLVSVLIPAYDAQAVLERAVNSVLAQSFSNFEVLIVDDASSDATADIAESLATRDERVRLISSDTNGGPGVARTLGLRQARGEWVAVLDADDEYEPLRLERLVSTAIELGLDMIADNLRLVDPGTHQIVGLAFPLSEGEIYNITPERMLQHTVPAGRINLGWCKPVVRKAFLQANEIEWRAFRHAEDFLLDMEVLLSGGKFALLGDALYHYMQRRGSKSKAVSQHSRTDRSVNEQQAVILDLLARYGHRMVDQDADALRRMFELIEVASFLQDLRDSLDRRNVRSACLAASRALRRPKLLWLCVAARFGTAAYTLAE